MRISDYLTITKDTMNAYNRMCEPILLQYNIPQVSFDILMFLTNNPEFCTAQEISEIRGGEYLEQSRTVDLHVQRLKKKLGWEEEIVAVYKVGYRLNV